MAAVPEFMKNHMGVGTEAFDQSDMRTPQLKLMQGISPELQADNSLRAGMFYHTGIDIGVEGPINAVLLYTDKRYILWNPRDAGGGILARADDCVHWSPANASFTVKLDKKDGGKTVTWKTANTVAESGLDKWGTMNPDDKDSPPAATLTYNFVFAFPDNPDLPPAVLRMQRAGVPSAQKFITKLKLSRLPIYGRVFSLDSAVETNNANQTFQTVTFTNVGPLLDEELFHEYEGLYLNFKKSGLEIKDLETGSADEMAPERAAAEPPTSRKARY